MISSSSLKCIWRSEVSFFGRRRNRSTCPIAQRAPARGSKLERRRSITSVWQRLA